jgi:hypothetical protein
MTVAEHVQERPDLHVGEQGVAEMRVPVDLVAVAAAFFGPREKALRNEVGDDLLRGPLADADAPCDLADPNRRVASDAKEHVAVVREDEPGRPRDARIFYGWLFNHGS